MAVLERELETYSERKHELLGIAQGKFVLIHGDEVCGLIRFQDGRHRRWISPLRKRAILGEAGSRSGNTDQLHVPLAFVLVLCGCRQLAGARPGHRRDSWLDNHRPGGARQPRTAHSGSHPYQGAP